MLWCRVKEKVTCTSECGKVVLFMCDVSDAARRSCDSINAVAALFVPRATRLISFSLVPSIYSLFSFFGVFSVSVYDIPFSISGIKRPLEMLKQPLEIESWFWLGFIVSTFLPNKTFYISYSSLPCV